MQISRFENGGYVIHKLSHGDNKYSAWFDKGGNMLEAELVLHEHTRSVQRGKPTWRTLEDIGRANNPNRKVIQHGPSFFGRICHQRYIEINQVNISLESFIDKMYNCPIDYLGPGIYGFNESFGGFTLQCFDKMMRSSDSSNVMIGIREDINAPSYLVG